MLKTRIIPVLLTTENHQCVKPNAFEIPFRILGPMLQYTKTMERRNIDELVILDITATRDKRVVSDIRHYINDLFCPISIGGGITSTENIRDLLATGADKVVISSGMYNFEGTDGVSIFSSLVDNAARKFGSQAITAALDVYDNHVTGVYEGQRKVLGQHFVWDIARALEDEGAGEILLTTVYNESAMDGYDLRNIEKVASAVSIPVIANGGCGKPEHMAAALRAGADAVAAGTMFLYTGTTPKMCAEYLHAEGFNVRLT